MKRIDKMLADLQKLYSKRSAIDTQIQGIEESLIAEVKATSKSAIPPKPTAQAAPKKSEKPAKKSTSTKK